MSSHSLRESQRALSRVRFYRGATDLDLEQRQKPEALNPRPQLARQAVHSALTLVHAQAERQRQSAAEAGVAGL